MGVPTAPEAGCWRWGSLLFALFLAASLGPVAAFKVATLYSLYVCPEGQNVTLTCRFFGPVDKGHDVTFYKTWYRSSRGEVQTCSERRPIRNLTFQDLHLHHGGHQAANTSHDLAQRHGLESASDHHGNFSITMRNLTLLDSGLYCCLVVEIRHHHSEHRVHGAMELQVQTGKDAPSSCVAYPSSSQESESKGPSSCPFWVICSLLSSSCTQTLFGTLALSPQAHRNPSPPPPLLLHILSASSLVQPPEAHSPSICSGVSAPLASLEWLCLGSHLWLGKVPHDRSWVPQAAKCCPSHQPPMTSEGWGSRIQLLQISVFCVSVFLRCSLL
uniref:V-type immunoglobulin domain-containing suppressor of T-cell activation isoform X1 n=1 Tax=Macaca mulatta TaxID=9544 RepID=UPI0010A2250C|nr:V-type immunoglobulin domain-containing suppressor of T-cell activation isoform X1 [Macaca mulatta]